MILEAGSRAKPVGLSQLKPVPSQLQGATAKGHWAVPAVQSESLGLSPRVPLQPVSQLLPVPEPERSTHLHGEPTPCLGTRTATPRLKQANFGISGDSRAPSMVWAGGRGRVGQDSAVRGGGMGSPRAQGTGTHLLPHVVLTERGPNTSLINSSKYF